MESDYRTPIARMSAIAEGQWGIITADQAKTVDVSPQQMARLARVGAMERLAHGIYRLRGSPEPDHLELRAAWVSLDPKRMAWARLGDPMGAVVSHGSAASLYGVGELRADVHEFTLPVRKQTRRPDVRLHKGMVDSEDRITLRGLPTTRAGKMLGDLLGDGVDAETVGAMTKQVLDNVQDYPRVIARHLARHAHRFGLLRGDGWAMLDYLLSAAGATETRELVRREWSGGSLR
jgi:hypothetical protein